MTGAVIAGGENSRLPVLKGLLTVNGKTIIENSLGILGNIFEKVVISTNMPEKYFRFKAPLIGDIMMERGPMTGILSVLAATGEDSVFVVACDMPFINEGLIRYMVESFEGQKTAVRGITETPNSELPAPNSGLEKVDAVIPVFEGREQPLFGIYANTVIKTMEKLIEQRQTGLTNMLKALRVLYIKEEEVKGMDPRGDAFININTMEDYEKIGGKICLA